MAGSESISDSIAHAVKQLIERTGAGAVTVSAFAGDGDAIIELCSAGPIASRYPAGLRRPVDGSSTLLFTNGGPAALDSAGMEHQVKRGIKEITAFLSAGFTHLYGTPVALNGKTLGCVQMLGRDAFTSVSTETADTFAALMAPYVALKVNELHSVEAERESEAIHKIAQTLISENKFEAVCDVVAESAGDSVGFDAMIVRKWDPASNKLNIVYRGGSLDPQVFAGPSFGLIESKLAPMAREAGVPILIDEGSPRVFDNPEYRPLMDEIPSFILAPLMEKGEFLGDLELYSINEYAYEEDDLNKVERLAHLLTSGVAHFSLIDALSHQAEVRGFLAEVARLASAADNLADLVINISRELRRLIEAEHVTFFIPSNRLAPFNLDNDLLSRSGVRITGMKSGESPCSRLRQEAGAKAATHLCTAADCIMAELWESDGAKESGWIHLSSGQQRSFTDSDSALLAEFARHIAPAIDNVLSHGAELRLANEKARADEAEASAAELQQQNDIKREFLATMSHELRTPLTPIRAFVDVLLRNAADNLTERQVQQLTVVKRNVEWLNLLINDLLDVSRIESGRFELQIEEIDVHTLLNGLVESLSPLISATGHKIRAIMPSAPVQITADNSRLSQVLGNLITNSIKYSPASTQIRVAFKKSGEGVSFYVRDEGIGIPVDQQPRVFDLFVRADTAASKVVNGSGIGLFVSKTIVESHGGRIGLTSVEGKHTTVHFWVPASPTRQAEAAIQQAA